MRGWKARGNCYSSVQRAASEKLEAILTGGA
jgi:hypothetical protein